jgi:prepilin-type N-terminal cleavage/methylation domain-containing protein/prepilin-type processing-associated H-X9-DG protein
MQRSKNAFTLIELLVVIAIIAILAAILFPVFAQAKAAAKKAVSLSNMKQTSLAANIYGNDFDDVFPAGGIYWNPGQGDALGWNDTPLGEWAAIGSPGPVAGTPNYPGNDVETNPFFEIFPYIKSMGMLTSPAVSQDSYYSSKSGAGNTSYVVNGGIEGKSLTTSDSPSALITFSEGPTNIRIGFAQPQQFPATNPDHENGIDVNWVSEGFSNYSGNYAFADGHAKAMPRSGVTYANYGLSGWVYDNYTGAWQANTFHLHNISLGAATNNDWISCGHVDISNTSLATGGLDATGNPCE